MEDLGGLAEIVGPIGVLVVVVAWAIIQYQPVLRIGIQKT